MSRLRRYLLTGIATILPIGATVFIFWFLITRFGAILRPLVARHVWLASLPGWLTTLVAFVFLLVIITAVGALASGIIGRWVVGRIDLLFHKLPVVKGIYGSARQLTEAVFVRRSSLRKTVVAEYPRRGILAVGFLTSDEELLLKDGRRAVFVFFPTAPNPTSGWLAIIPQEDITETAMSIDEGLKLVVSGGVVKPETFGDRIRQAKLTEDEPGPSLAG